VLSQLCLLIAQDCNLRCRYCYAGDGCYGAAPSLMTWEVAQAALDLFLREAGDADHLSLLFFGGEPLLNFPLLRQVAESLEERAKQAGKRLDLIVSTNATLLTPEVAAYLLDHHIEVLVSLDGPIEVHDLLRPDASGKGTYERVVGNLRTLLDEHKLELNAVATITHQFPQTEAVITHLLDLGFRRAWARPVASPDPQYALDGQDWDTYFAGYRALAERFYAEAEQGRLFGWATLIHRLQQLEHNEGPHYRCAAGTRQISVAVNGTLYPCHRLVGDERYRWGDVFSGLEPGKREEFLARAQLDQRTICGDCDLATWCGGSCSYLGVTESDDLFAHSASDCRRSRTELELAREVRERLSHLGRHWLPKLLLNEELTRTAYAR